MVTVALVLSKVRYRLTGQYVIEICVEYGSDQGVKTEHIGITKQNARSSPSHKCFMFCGLHRYDLRLLPSQLKTVPDFVDDTTNNAPDFVSTTSVFKILVVPLLVLHILPVPLMQLQILVKLLVLHVLVPLIVLHILVPLTVLQLLVRQLVLHIWSLPVTVLRVWCYHLQRSRFCRSPLGFIWFLRFLYH